MQTLGLTTLLRILLPLNILAATELWTSFTSSTNSWGYSTWTCNGMTAAGNLDLNAVLTTSHTFTRTPFRFDYSYELWMINTPDTNENWNFYINDYLFDSFDDTSPTGSYGTASCSMSGTWNIAYRSISRTVTSVPPLLSGTTYTFMFTNNLNQHLADESWSVYNFRVTAYLCDSTCLTCNGESSNQCLTCPTGRSLYTGGSGIQCVTSCPGRYTDVSGTCIHCSDPHCLECSEPNYCTKCENEYYFLSSNNDCQPCFGTCKTCPSASSTQCTSCVTNYYQYQIPYGSAQFQCIYPCPTRYATVSGVCIPCTDSKCITCYPQSTCTYCEPGYYVYGSSCSLCHTTCLTCSSSGSASCTSCKPNYYVYSKSIAGTSQCITASSCQAINKYTILGSECVPCNDPNCQTCSSVSVCTTCQNGFYLTSASTCDYCDSSCSTCLGPTISDCTGCASGRFKVTLYPGAIETSFQCNATCNDGYALYSSQCMPCQIADCVLCPTNPTICTKCSGSLLLSSNKCISGISMLSLGIVGNYTVMVGFTEALFDILAGDLTSYLSVSIEGISSSSYSYLLSKSNDSMVVNITFTWFTTVDPGTVITISLSSGIASTINSTLLSYGFYMANTWVVASLAGNIDTDEWFGRDVSGLMNILGPISSGFYLVAMALSNEGSLLLGGAVSLEIVLLNRAINIDYPPNIASIFFNAYNPPVPFVFPLTLEVCGLQPIAITNTLPNATNLKTYIPNGNFIDNTFRDIFTMIVLLIIIGGIAGIVKLLRNQKGTGIIKKIQVLFTWNLFILVGMSVSLRSLFYIFLNFTFPSVSEGFGITSLIFSTLFLIAWIPAFIGVVAYINRKKVNRILDGRTTKKLTKRGKFDILYEEFLEVKHVRKYYIPVYFVRNLSLAFAAAVLNGFPLFQAIYGVMVNMAFAMYVIIARPWSNFIKLGLHIIFDLGVIINSIFVLGLAIMDYQGFWLFDTRYTMGNGFVIVNLILIIVNLVASVVLAARALWKTFYRPCPKKIKTAKKVPKKQEIHEPMTVKDLDVPVEKPKQKPYLQMIEQQARAQNNMTFQEEDSNNNDITQLTSSIIMGANSNTLIHPGESLPLDNDSMKGEASTGRESAFRVLESFVTKRRDNMAKIMAKKY